MPTLSDLEAWPLMRQWWDAVIEGEIAQQVETITNSVTGLTIFKINVPGWAGAMVSSYVLVNVFHCLFH